MRKKKNLINLLRDLFGKINLSCLSYDEIVFRVKRRLRFLMETKTRIIQEKNVENSSFNIKKYTI